MKIELVIADERLQQQLIYAAIQAPQDEAPELTAARGAMNILLRYAEMPETVGRKHSAALTILRNQAMEQAIRAAAPGDDGYQIKRRAEDVLDHILGR